MGHHSGLISASWLGFYYLNWKLLHYSSSSKETILVLRKKHRVWETWMTSLQPTITLVVFITICFFRSYLQKSGRKHSYENFASVENKGFGQKALCTATLNKKKREFHYAMSIVSCAIFAVTDIHWFVSSNTSSCCPKRFAKVDMFLMHSVTLLRLVSLRSCAIT